MAALETSLKNNGFGHKVSKIFLRFNSLSTKTYLPNHPDFFPNIFIRFVDFEPLLRHINTFSGFKCIQRYVCEWTECYFKGEKIK